MIFLNGDNNLEGYAIDDFLEISKSNIDTSVANILVQFDRISGYDTRYGNWTDTKRFYVTKDMTPDSSNAIMDCGELNMGDKNILSDFVKWGIENYSADHFALIIWDHGNSWYKNKSMEIKDISNDETSDSSIGIGNGELRSALRNVYNQYGIKPDILGIDCCISQTITLSAEVQPYVNYIIASEDFESEFGWEYTTPLNYLFENSGDITPKDLGKKICSSYYDVYLSSPTEMNWNTLSLLDMSQFNAFLDNFDILTDKFIQFSALGQKETVINILDNYSLLNNQSNSDLGKFLNDISVNPLFMDDVRLCANNALNAYNNFVSTTVGSYFHTFLDRIEATGLTIYYGNESSYGDSIFSNSHNWDNFLFGDHYEDPYKIYPNPTTGNFTLSGLLRGDEVNIYTVSGSLLYSFNKFHTMDKEIDLSKYANGIYFVVINSTDNGIVYRKIAKIK